MGKRRAPSRRVHTLNTLNGTPRFTVLVWVCGGVPERCPFSKASSSGRAGASDHVTQNLGPE